MYSRYVNATLDEWETFGAARQIAAWVVAMASSHSEAGRG